jgi:hypothetical protein
VKISKYPKDKNYFFYIFSKVKNGKNLNIPTQQLNNFMISEGKKILFIVKKLVKSQENFDK